MRRLLPLASLVVLGCSSGSDEDERQSVLRDSAKAPVEKAEAVEGLVLDSKDRIDESVDTAGE
jgi:hypothetical protein